VGTTASSGAAELDRALSARALDQRPGHRLFDIDRAHRGDALSAAMNEGKMPGAKAKIPRRLEQRAGCRRRAFIL
jgi:hypothetical protein